MPRDKSYGQFCPVAQASEVIAERWTPLVLRELMCGSHRFGELRKGVPLMSPSLLSQRLRQLEEAGVIERRSPAAGSGGEYHLTAAGEELRPVIELLGLWGHQWLRRGVREHDLDPALLMWDIRRRVNSALMPADTRLVVLFELSGAPRNKGRWWLVFSGGQVDLCLKNPGYQVDLRVGSTVRTLVDVWLGRRDLAAAIRGQDVVLEGTRVMTRSFKAWFTLSAFAKVPVAPGSERRAS